MLNAIAHAEKIERAMMAQDGSSRSFNLGLGIEKLGLLALRLPTLVLVSVLVAAVIGFFGYQRLSVDDSLSELFRTNTEEFRRFETVSKRFPSNEFDVLVVVEGRDLLKPKPFDALRNVVFDLGLTDGVSGLVSLFSARGALDGKGYAPPLVPDDLPQDAAAYKAMIDKVRANEIVKGTFLSNDGELALIVLALDPRVVSARGTDAIIQAIRGEAEAALQGSGLTVKLTGAPVMQYEIRNAVKRDQLVYNGLGVLFGALIALFFFRRLSLMIVAAVPPLLATLVSLGFLGWLGFKLNLFLNVMTPLVMVLGFADSMQMTSAIRIRLREGDSKIEALRFAIRVVGPACVLAHGAVLLSFLALQLSDSGLIRTFGAAGAVATIISFVAVILALPTLGYFLIRNEASLSKVTAPADRAMDWLSNGVGRIVDWVVARPASVTVMGFVLFALFGWAYSQLEPRYRLANQVPDQEQALAATGSLDEKLTGANPVHVMVEWRGQDKLYTPQVLSVIAQAHQVLEKVAGLGNVWSVQSLRAWLARSGNDNPETVKKFIELLPKHLVHRFVATDEKSVLVTGRLPDVDASEILPVVERIDKALQPLREANPGFTSAVTGLPAIAARNSATMIAQLNAKLPLEVIFV
ncbi:MAG: MMPL family transporter, partial [Pseudomonadota bacterium]